MVRGSIALFALLLLLLTRQLFAATLTDIQVNNSKNQAKISMEFDGSPVYSFFPLTKPDRVVLDIQQMGQMVSGLPLNFSGKNLLTKIRRGDPKDKESLRLVFELSDKAQVQATTKKNGGRHSVIFTLVAEKPTQAVAKKISNTAPPTTKQTPANLSNSFSRATNTTTTDKTPASTIASVPRSSSQAGKTPVKRNPVVIAIDSGHGGQDPGAIGPSRLYEKTVTLAVARKLQARLQQDPLFHPVMTRNGDYFVSVMGRSDIARNKKANLLVSIHADAAPNKNARGASVWVLSNKRANSELGRWLEEHEKQSELLGGAGDVLANRARDPYLSQTVLDLQFGHSQKVSYDVAKQILNQFSQIGKLHKRNPEHASLGVLRSPDIPSLLVETGFISNRDEEKLLGNAKHQDKIANAIYQGIRSYFLANPLQIEMNTTSKTESNRHTVKKGDTLSSIARKYGVSITELKRINKLQSNTVVLEQTLIIP